VGPAPMRNHSHTTSTNGDSLRRIEVITGVGRRRRWTNEEKAWIVAESLDPATTGSAVARRYGLPAAAVRSRRSIFSSSRGSSIGLVS
jgi:transposase-like protein